MSRPVLLLLNSRCVAHLCSNKYCSNMKLIKINFCFQQNFLGMNFTAAIELLFCHFNKQNNMVQLQVEAFFLYVVTIIFTKYLKITVD